jgi:predicted DNA-binding transcriptional regulator AlpA
MPTRCFTGILASKQPEPVLGKRSLPMGQHQFLNVQQAAQWLGIATKTLDSWRANGSGPPCHRFGRAVRYRLSDLEAFAAKAKSAPAGGGADAHTKEYESILT